MEALAYLALEAAEAARAEHLCIDNFEGSTLARAGVGPELDAGASGWP